MDFNPNIEQGNSASISGMAPEISGKLMANFGRESIEEYSGH